MLDYRRKTKTLRPHLSRAERRIAMLQAPNLSLDQAHKLMIQARRDNRVKADSLPSLEN